MTEDEYWEEIRLQHYSQESQYQQWLNECRECATYAGCPDDYVRDEQRWRFMFDHGFCPEDAVQEDLKEGAE